MTDLNKLLYVASKLYHYVELRGDEVWVGDEIKEPEIIGGPEVKNETFDLFILQPHKPTERGKAQLMDIVFAVTKKSKSLEFMVRLCNALSEGNSKKIIELAAEVL